jgi:hypothetical protein
VLGGALSCFAGYRLFKLTLAIYGFIFGSMIASSTMGVSNTTGMIVAALVGGVAGAVVLVFAYFIGIALAGACLGALLAHMSWGTIRPGDPPPVLVMALAILGAIGAMLLQRYVIIVATAFCGALTIIVGALAIAADRTGGALRVGDVWILYPMAPAPGERWVPVAWVMLGLFGSAVELGITGRKR